MAKFSSGLMRLWLAIFWTLANSEGGNLVVCFSPVLSSAWAKLRSSSSMLNVVESSNLVEDSLRIALNSSSNRVASNLGLDMPDGLRESLEINAHIFHKHIWILDNSGSMIMEDGHRAVSLELDCKVKECSRWQEVQETVNCHSHLAEALGAPTDFKLLNSLKGKKGAKPETFRVGYNINKKSHKRKRLFGNSLAARLTNPTKHMESVLAKAKPSGMTPLPECIAQVKREVESILPQLQAERKKVSIVIATDGSNYNLDNIGNSLLSEEERNEELVQALESLQDLPVSVVIRLCTDYKPLVNFFNGLDRRMDWNLNLDVVDDHQAEACQVRAHQPWLNYALLLHRMREMGHYHPLLSVLDERPLTAPEIRKFLQLLLGRGHFKRPYEDTEEWKINFLHEVMDLQETASFGFHWTNPLTNCKEPWIDIEQLAYTLLDDDVEEDFDDN